jgi:probable rRNA maturation factor
VKNPVVRISLNQVSRGPVWLDRAFEARVRRAAAGLGPGAARVSVVILDDREIRRLNRVFRGKNRATDVLSFPYDDAALRRSGDRTIGDVYVSYETVAREARRMGLERRDLALRIVVHGLLHVLGYDHENDADAARMERRERAVLKRRLPAAALAALFPEAGQGRGRARARTR